MGRAQGRLGQDRPGDLSSSAKARRRSCWARAAQTIKKIGELARKEMEELFGRRVHLFLFVKVREDWAENREHYSEIGLEFPNE